jgi:hypothetical protein
MATAIVVPVALRSRVVLLVLGVRDEPFAISDLPELVAFVPRVVAALERIILKRKKGASFAKSEPAGTERERLKNAALGARESVAPRRPRLDRWSGGPAASPSAATEQAAASVAARSARPAVSSHPRGESSLADAILSGAGEPEAAPPAAEAPHPTPALTAKPRTLLGIPKSAPPPPDMGFVVPLVELPPRDLGGRTTLPLGPPQARSTVPTPPPVTDDDDEPELTVSESDDDEPELSVSDSDPEVEVDGDDDDVVGRVTSPSLPPVVTHDAAPPAGLIAPQTVSSSYAMTDVGEDVVVPLKRSRPRPGESDPRESRPPAEGRSRDPRREDGAELAADRVPMRAVERTVERPPTSVPSPPPGRVSQIPPSREVPSVIVDMGDAVENLVVDLQHAGPDDERAAVNALLRMGEAALPVLAQTFPGPLWFDRHRPHRRAPRGRDVCAISRAFYAFGVRATPYVATLIGSSHPDKRYYALLLAGDMVHPSLLDAVLARLFDEDDSIRKLAHEIAPRFRGLSGWDEQMNVLRRSARIRGKDPKKRIHALAAIAAIRDAGALGALVELLEDDDREVVRQAHVALVALTAEDLGLSPRKWTAWVEKHGKRHRIEWLIDALTHSDETLRTAAGDELKQLTQQYFGFHPSTTRREREVAQEKYRRWWQAEGKKQLS